MHTDDYTSQLAADLWTAPLIYGSPLVGKSHFKDAVRSLARWSAASIIDTDELIAAIRPAWADRAEWCHLDYSDVMAFEAMIGNVVRRVITGAPHFSVLVVTNLNSKAFLTRALGTSVNASSARFPIGFVRESEADVAALLAVRGDFVPPGTVPGPIADARLTEFALNSARAIAGIRHNQDIDRKCARVVTLSRGEFLSDFAPLKKLVEMGPPHFWPAATGPSNV